MRTRAPMLTSAALVSLGLAGCDAKPAGISPPLASYCQLDAAAVEAHVDRVLAALTREQKAMLSAGNLALENAWSVGGVPELGVPQLAMIDGPRGVGKRAGHATAFPVAMARGASWDPALEQRVGEAIGKETRAKGISVILAPTLNLLRHPSWGRAQETYGEDPVHLGRFASAFIQGAQQHVMATAKHFAVNSIEDTRMVVDVLVDERTLREIYLPHFAAVVQSAHAAAVMSGYNSVNGAFCGQNVHLLREILKGEWGFSGFVMSDWAFGTHDTIASAQAGLDLEMPSDHYYGAPLRDAVDQGAVDPALLDDMVRRRLRAMYCYGLDTNPPVADPAQVESDAARVLAREAAERSLVLLANVGAALPLARKAGSSIVVTGPLADVQNLGDHGSSDVDPSVVVTPLAGLRASAGPASIKYLPAGPSDPAAQASIAAADAVVVFVGLTAEDEGEGQIAAGDRIDLGLHPADVALIHSLTALSRRVIVVLQGGSAITMEDFLPEVQAVLLAWYPGVEGGNAIAAALFGDVNPSGRLPLSIPHSAADLPPFDDASARVTYGYFHGYRHLDHEGKEPRFPFGYGLSYTTFAFADLALSATELAATDVLSVRLRVKNTGAVAGRQTIQVYLGPETSKVSPRCVRELRGFAQVDLLPGEERSLTIDIPIASLAYWDLGQSAFVVEPTRYRVEVGSSSRDLPLAGSITVVR